MSGALSRTATLKAAALIAASTYVTTGLGLLVSVVVARSLGPAEYGQYAYLLWLSALLVTFGNNGLSVSGIRFISEALGRQQPQDASGIHGWLKRWQWLSLALVISGFLIATLLWPPGGWHQPVWILGAVLAISVITKAAFQFDISVAKGYSQFGIESWSIMIMSLIYTCGVLLLGWLHASLVTFAWFFAAVSAGHMAISTYMLKRAGIAPSTPQNLDTWLPRIKSHLGWTIVLVLVGALSNKTIETFLLSTLSNPADLGYFAIANNLTRGGVELLSSTLGTMLMPMMGHAFGQGGIKQVNRILSDAMRYFLFLGLILAGLGGFWAAAGVSIMYGDQYAPVVDVLRVLLLIGGLTLAEGAFGALLSTTDHQHVRVVVSVLSVSISAIAAFALVPQYGLMGAVMAHAISRILVFLATMAGLIRLMSIRMPFSAMARLLLAAAMAGSSTLPLLWLSHGIAMQFAAGITYTVVFIWSSTLVGGWQRKDVETLLAIARRQPRLLGWMVPHLEHWSQRLPTDG